MILNTRPLNWESTTLTTKPKGRAKKIKNPKAFIDYPQTTDDVYENLEDYNPTKKSKVLIVFDHMRADIESNQKLRYTVLALAYEKQGRATIACLVTKFRGYIHVKSCMPPTKKACGSVR